MSVKTIYTCNKCGKEIAKESDIEFTITSPSISYLNLRSDFCSITCFKEYITNFNRMYDGDQL
jgi:hypothetical protein